LKYVQVATDSFGTSLVDGPSILQPCEPKLASTDHNRSQLRLQNAPDCVGARERHRIDGASKSE
jgi:hypothetical protein